MSDTLAIRINAALTARTELVDLVGDRIYYGIPAQGVGYPQVSFMINSDDFIASLDGVLGSDLEDANVELQVWSPDNLEAARVAKEVMIALDEAETFACTALEKRENYEQSDKFYNVEIDAEIWNYPER